MSLLYDSGGDGVLIHDNAPCVGGGRGGSVMIVDTDSAVPITHVVLSRGQSKPGCDSPGAYY